MAQIFLLLLNFPGKSLGFLRIPIDLALIRAGFNAEGVVLNQWILFVGLAGLISSMVLILFSDQLQRTNQLDPQDSNGYFKWLVFWKYPWEFASAMAFIKSLNLFLSGMTHHRFDDLFLGFCVLVGQLIVQIPERSIQVRYVPRVKYLARVRNWVISRPNRICAYIMSLGNVVFVWYSLSPIEVFRVFSGVWNIFLNIYLMTRASKRLRRKESKHS